MQKYSTKTYGRSRFKETKSSTAFDELNNSKPNVSSETNFNKNLSRKSPWARTSRTVNNNANLVKETSTDILKTNKRRKLTVIDETDPFAFSEDDVTGIDVANRRFFRNKSTQPVKASSTDLTDKSTDDEAYSSSQECSETSSQGSDVNKSYSSSTSSYKKSTASPFKSFLKNNGKSLSPKKGHSSRRLSALPTNAEFCEDSQEEACAEVPSIIRSSSWPRRKKDDMTGAVRVKRKEKPLFTVVQNVKQVHECLESGEDQQFFDDVEYLLDGLKQTRSIATRCLSALEFASHCCQPSFRVSLRAHGIVPKVFSFLQDAPHDKCLALCTAAIVLMLTQDRQNVDLDKFVLELMMKLLAIDNSSVQTKSSKDYNKCVCKIRSLVEKQNGTVQPCVVDEGDISPASLVCESLVSLTSHRTGEWFSEGIRSLHGLDHIMDAVTQTVDHLLTRQKDKTLYGATAIAKLRKVTRCMRLLENVTTQNPANQVYLVTYIKGSVVTALARLLHLCLTLLKSRRSDEAFEDCFLNILKVFLNLTHNYEAGSSCVGQQDGLLLSLLLTVTQLPQFVSEGKRFDVLVLSLGLLINLVEDSKQNIASLVQLHCPTCHESQEPQEQGEKLTSIEALIQLFLLREQAARNTDEMTSGLSTEEESSQESLKPTKDGMGWICGEDIDASVDEELKSESSPVSAVDVQPGQDISLEVQLGKALQKAGKHMEDSVVAAYVALLLGCIIQDNQANQAIVGGLLPGGDFSLLVNVVRKFLGFMKLTSGTSGHAVEKIMRILESCQ